jgi:hypothetical protein
MQIADATRESLSPAALLRKETSDRTGTISSSAKNCLYFILSGGLRPARLPPVFVVPSARRAHWRAGGSAMACNCFATNQQDIDELMRAASIGNVEYIRSAVRTPALLDARDRFGQTAVHWAAYRGQLQVLQLLVEAGGSLSLRDNDGRVALHWAVRKDRTRCVRYIIQRGSPLDVQTKGTGETALHKAARQGNAFTVEMLLVAGARRNMSTSYHQTPLDVAEEMLALEQKFRRDEAAEAEEGVLSAGAKDAAADAATDDAVDNAKAAEPEATAAGADAEGADTLAESTNKYATGEHGDPDVEDEDKFGPIVRMLREFDDTMVDKDKIFDDGEGGSDAGARARRKRELYQEGGPMAEVLEERLASGQVKPSKGCAVM